MKRKMIIGGIVLLAASLALCQQIGPLPGKVTFKVHDDRGTPVSGVTVTFGAQIGIDMSKGGSGHDIENSYKNETDENGTVSFDFLGLSGNCGAHIERAGYYEWTNGPQLHFNRQPGRLEPWNPTIDITLKRVINPIPMIAKAGIGIHFNNAGEKYWLDLEKMDWLPPMGNGKIADIEFHLTGNYTSRENSSLRVSVSFLNPGDGVVAFMTPDRNHGSRLLSDHTAPISGYGSMKELYYIAKSKEMIRSSLDASANYYFRVRSRFDKDGNLISANYGKIYEDIELGIPFSNPCAFVFLKKVYFNPTIKDRNVEFDVNRNLLSTDEGHRVQDP